MIPPLEDLPVGMSMYTKCRMGKALFLDAKEQEKEQNAQKQGVVLSILQQAATSDKKQRHPS
jgi:hypothetical protein